MAYMQILKALHRTLQQTTPQHSVQKCVFTHTHRTVSAVSKLTFRRKVEPASSVIAVLSCLRQTHRLRGFSTDSTARSKSSPEERDKSVSRYQGGSPKASATQKVKEAGRDFTYFIVVLIGLGVTGGLLYVVFQELFSSSSPNKIYGKAFNKVRLDPEVIGAFGEPIRCYGETTRRGRRQQSSGVHEGWTEAHAVKVLHRRLGARPQRNCTFRVKRES
uniref:mitochondrial import inner membrane translocase subunit Tim21-like isoform X2 n=1 Tax=Scatophagus argus TaxID=75038 RepID=UPI001ED815ED|nr:mitochondrial import inner membrane translocase subunit Tim21-like isoform X2 [Scatophagus argus]